MGLVNFRVLTFDISHYSSFSDGIWTYGHILFGLCLIWTQPVGAEHRMYGLS